MADATMCIEPITLTAKVQSAMTSQSSSAAPKAKPGKVKPEPTALQVEWIKTLKPKKEMVATIKTNRKEVVILEGNVPAMASKLREQGYEDIATKTQACIRVQATTAISRFTIYIKASTNRPCAT
jgi:hypothetical protein